jgi:hypothetical protein
VTLLQPRVTGHRKVASRIQRPGNPAGRN